MADDEVSRVNLETAIQALMEIAGAADNPTGREPHEIAGEAVQKIIARRMGVPETAVAGRVSVSLPAARGPERQRWAKWVIGLNPGQRGGYAFEGPFLRPGQAHSLPPGAVIIQHESDRGTKGAPCVWMSVVLHDGSLHNHDVSVDKSWASRVSDVISKYWAGQRRT